TLRTEGRKVYAEVYPDVAKQAERIAAKTGINPLEVHHRIPLEYRSLFQDTPNRIANLIGLNKNVHAEISGLWTSFRNANPNATARDVLDFAIKIDKKYGRYFNTLEGDVGMPFFK